MNGKQIKKYLKSKGHTTVRVHTGTGKTKWITAWIPSDRENNGWQICYTAKPFSVELREACLRVVFPNHPELIAQGAAGNITSYSISMTQAQWAAFGISQGLEIV